jgi:hypothetical protein
VVEHTSKIRDTTGTVFIQGPSIVLLVWRIIMFNGSFLRVCRILWFVKKLDFAFLSLGGPSPGARVWCLGRVPKHRNQWQEVEGLLFSPQKLLVGAYFELLFLGYGFLIHLSNRSDSPRFRAPSKKIRQKYDIQQELSLFKGHPLSCQYGYALCSMVPT